MSIGTILKKLMWGEKKTNPDGTIIRGKTPDEVELESYQRDEYLQNVKLKLQRFRNKKNREAIVGNNPLAMKGTILQKHKYQLMK
jgi:uncharacterized protein YeaC (DUF1315 family)